VQPAHRRFVGVGVMAGIIPRLPALFVLYVLLAGQASTDEIVAAVLTTAAATVFSRAQRGLSDRGFHILHLPLARMALGAATSLITDTARVSRHLARLHPRPGRLERNAIPFGGDTPGDAGRRALETLRTSIAPNSFVVAMLGGRAERIVHRLSTRAG
jgi:hypothetical protein